jgi:hypothetical protein
MTASISDSARQKKDEQARRCCKHGGNISSEIGPSALLSQ